MVYDVIIIGAGAAGLFSAARHAPVARGLILEGTGAAGSKLLLAGAGACNFTHAGDIRTFPAHYGESGAKIRTILYKCNNTALIEYFESLGIQTLTREDGKVFPASLRARDLLSALITQAESQGFTLRYDSPLTAIRPEEAAVTVTAGGREYTARKLIIACGGKSFPATGSNGSIYPILETLGVSIVPLRPALAPVFVQDYPYGDLSGISFENARVTILGGARPAVKSGAVLFTHENFSGPAILDIAAHTAPGYTLSVNYLPDQNRSELSGRLRSALSGERRHTSGFLAEACGLPRRFAESICRRLCLPERAAALSGEQQRSVLRLLFEDRFSISGTGGYASAMATAGGVSLEEVDSRTLTLKKNPRIHIIGETLDVCGDTGGYNIHFAFASGYTAARA